MLFKKVLLTLVWATIALAVFQGRGMGPLLFLKWVGVLVVGAVVFVAAAAAIIIFLWFVSKIPWAVRNTFRRIDILSIVF